MSDVLTASGGSREDTTCQRWPLRSAAVYRLGIRRNPVEEEEGSQEGLADAKLVIARK